MSAWACRAGLGCKVSQPIAHAIITIMSDIMTPKITQACRICLSIRPNISTRAKGNTQKFITVRMLLQALGFSKGCDELAPKKPPPLVPRCLMGMMAATGPRLICWGIRLAARRRCPSTPVRAWSRWRPMSSVMGTPSARSMTPMIRLAGRNM